MIFELPHCLCSLYVSNQSMMDAREEDYQQNIHHDFPSEPLKQGQNLNTASILIHKWTNFSRCSFFCDLEKRERASLKTKDGIQESSVYVLNISKSRQRERSSRVFVFGPKLPHISQRSFNTNSTSLDSNDSQP